MTIYLVYIIYGVRLTRNRQFKLIKMQFVCETTKKNAKKLKKIWICRFFCLSLHHNQYSNTIFKIMFKKTFAILIAFLMVANIANAQSERKNVIKVNYLSPIVSTASLFYERVVGKNTSVQLGLAYTGAKIGAGDAKTSINGFYITPEFRYYASKKGAPTGFFVAPYLRYQNLSLKATTSAAFGFPATESKATFSSFGGGIVLGGQWLFGDRVSLEVFGGPAYNAGSIKTTSGDEDDFSIGGIGGFGFRFGSTLGIAF